MFNPDSYRETNRAMIIFNIKGSIYTIENRQNKQMKNWLKLISGALFIFAFIFYFPKASRRIPAVNSLHQKIEEKGIEANALFYSEEKSTKDAEFEINDRLSKQD